MQVNVFKSTLVRTAVMTFEWFREVDISRRISDMWWTFVGFRLLCGHSLRVDKMSEGGQNIFEQLVEHLSIRFEYDLLSQILIDLSRWPRTVTAHRKWRRSVPLPKKSSCISVRCSARSPRMQHPRTAVPNHFVSKLGREELLKLLHPLGNQTRRP